MSSPEAACALQIIEDDFGTPAKRVCESLLFHTDQTIFELMKQVAMPFHQIRKCLLALITHSVVGFVERSIGAEIITRYFLNIKGALNRVRFPKFAFQVRQSLGESAEMIFDEFLQRGRCSLGEVVGRLMDFETTVRGLVAPEAQRAKREEFRQGFVALVQERFLVGIDQVKVEELSADADEALTPAQQATATATATSTSTARYSAPKRGGATRGRSARWLLLASSSLPALGGPLSLPPGAEAEAPQRRGIGPSGSAPRPPRHRPRLPSVSRSPLLFAIGGSPPSGLTATPQAAAPLADNLAQIDENALWQVSFDRFTMVFRQLALLNFASEKWKEVGSAIVAAILRLTSPTERLTDRVSSPVTSDEIFKEIPATSNISRELLAQFLDAMCRESPSMLTRTTDTTTRTNYVINTAVIVEYLRHRCLESIVFEQHGMEAHRIFRLLHMKRQLEQKQIAEMAMLPVSECRRHLYGLLAREYLRLQEIPETADRQPSRTFYLWSVNMDQALVGGGAAVGSALVTNAGGESEGAAASGDPSMLQQLQRGLERLEVAISRLDETLLFLRDF
ncbi:putative dna-directed rna polymerase iii subunit rpc3 [Paratrimastix pyriformis]|uniref:DNA-directed RNA polymerase III subunit RPC3 n=1 Tax=Paratrimastix pyriformis TaxID=342808 RepID=A0ABQ8URR7_9EUKA|nr:putative dna-directed rna polymerase iii subunit rpc3 [Paratrimastix pyriformis]